MEASTASAIPKGGEWQYEPKWDGFRCLAFRDGAEIVMMSKSGQRLDRYFPEIVSALKSIPAKKFVLDGELILHHGKHTDFDALLQRIHPAESRIKRLSAETPATFVIFDLLVDAAGKAISRRPLESRRKPLDH